MIHSLSCVCFVKDRSYIHRYTKHILISELPRLELSEQSCEYGF